MSDQASPITQLHRLRDELEHAVSKQKWKTAKNRARSITKLLPVVMDKDPNISKMGSSHLDGLYMIGWQRIMKAMPKAKQAIEKMNQAILQARSKLPKTKKKKKK